MSHSNTSGSNLHGIPRFLPSSSSQSLPPMSYRALFAALIATFLVADAIELDHDAVVPFAQPMPVTISEKVGAKFRPSIYFDGGCMPYPAVEAAGDFTGGLKGSAGSSACTDPPSGSQVYERATWHDGRYAIMFAWYFPKGFFAGLAFRRHDWASVILWIDNPEVETPMLLGIAASVSDHGYTGKAPAPAECFINGTTMNLFRALDTFPHIDCTVEKDRGTSQSLIMWNQLTEAARTTLNTKDFGKAEVPFNEYNFIGRLDDASPF